MLGLAAQLVQEVLASGVERILSGAFKMLQLSPLAYSAPPVEAISFTFYLSMTLVGRL